MTLAGTQLSTGLFAQLSKVYLEVDCEETAPGQSLVVVGSVPELGSWDVAKGKRLQTSPARWPTWYLEKPVCIAGAQTVLFKFVVQSEASGVEPQWEALDGDRIFEPEPGGEMTIHCG